MSNTSYHKLSGELKRGKYFEINQQMRCNLEFQSRAISKYLGWEMPWDLILRNLSEDWNHLPYGSCISVDN